MFTIDSKLVDQCCNDWCAGVSRLAIAFTCPVGWRCKTAENSGAGSTASTVQLCVLAVSRENSSTFTLLQKSLCHI